MQEVRRFWPLRQKMQDGPSRSRWRNCYYYYKEEVPTMLLSCILHIFVFHVSLTAYSAYVVGRDLKMETLLVHHSHLSRKPRKRSHLSRRNHLRRRKHLSSKSSRRLQVIHHLWLLGAWWMCWDFSSFMCVSELCQFHVCLNYVILMCVSELCQFDVCASTMSVSPVKSMKCTWTMSVWCMYLWNLWNAPLLFCHLIICCQQWNMSQFADHLLSPELCQFSTEFN